MNTLQGHRGSIWCLQLTGSTLTTGSADETIKLWDLETEACIATLPGHKASVASIYVYEKYLISASLDKSIKVWDLTSRVTIKSFVGHEAAVGCVQLDGMKVVSGSADETVKIWDLRSSKCLSTMRQDSAVACLQFEEEKLAIGTRKKLRMCDYSARDS